MAKIDHAAIRTSSYEDAQKFFEDVFDMHMWREIGEKPERKCWFREGIQLCEEFKEAFDEKDWDNLFYRKNNGKDQSLSGKADQ